MIAAQSVLVPATSTTRFAVRVMVASILATALFLVLQYPSLPWLLPVHFRSNGAANGWQFRTMPRVLMPVFVQVALAATLGSITALLLSRKRGFHDPRAADVLAASTAAEAVALIATIWVAFQGYAAVALVGMWTTGRAGLGSLYVIFELLGFVLTGIVATRAHVRLGRPAPRPFVAEHWRFGLLYANPADPALFVPTRQGRRWTLNFGRPGAVALLGLILAVGVIGPTLLIGLALR
ncbi:MAG: DUF1648 domain-containing protein [Vicinamibacterales bacterium]